MERNDGLNPSPVSWRARKDLRASWLNLDPEPQRKGELRRDYVWRSTGSQRRSEGVKCPTELKISCVNRRVFFFVIDQSGSTERPAQPGWGGIRREARCLDLICAQARPSLSSPAE
jgi:hypothetical protein